MSPLLVTLSQICRSSSTQLLVHKTNPARRGLCNLQSHLSPSLLTIRPRNNNNNNHAPSQNRTLLTDQPNITRRMPAQAWDSHMHVTSPSYPLAATAAYKPSLHSLQHALTFESTIAVPNIVLVQPSIYGNDNSCLLDALREIGPLRGRGVVGVDPATIDNQTLREWHDVGVRGVRLNLKSTNAKFDQDSLKTTLQQYAKVIRPLDWVLELFVGMEAIAMLEPLVADLGVKVCIAHFGAPTLPPVKERSGAGGTLDPYNLPGFRALVNLLREGNTWVKFSAAYRFDDDAEMGGIEALARELLSQAGDRVVFASDWPHTRFDGIDVRPFVERCLQWTDEAGLSEKVFRLNAEELWDVKR